MKNLITSRNIPEGARPVDREGVDAIAYCYEEGKNFCVVAYAGRKKRPAFHHAYTNEERRDSLVDTFLDEQEARCHRKAAERAARQQFKTGLQIGDVLWGSYGYEQTNLAFYEVVALRARTTLSLRRLSLQKTYNERGLCGYAVPMTGQYQQEAIPARARPGDLVVVDHVHLQKWDGEPKYFSEYA